MKERDQLIERLSTRMGRYAASRAHETPHFDHADYSAMEDARAMLADLSFEECDKCAGTGTDEQGHDCKSCKGVGTIPVWSDPV